MSSLTSMTVAFFDLYFFYFLHHIISLRSQVVITPHLWVIYLILFDFFYCWRLWHFVLVKSLFLWFVEHLRSLTFFMSWDFKVTLVVCMRCLSLDSNDFEPWPSYHQVVNFYMIGSLTWLFWLACFWNRSQVEIMNLISFN